MNTATVNLVTEVLRNNMKNWDANEASFKSLTIEYAMREIAAKGSLTIMNIYTEDYTERVITF